MKQRVYEVLLFLSEQCLLSKRRDGCRNEVGVLVISSVGILRFETVEMPRLEFRGWRGRGVVP